MFSSVLSNAALRCLAVVVALAISSASRSAALAEELPGSLSLAPADADYYAASFRNGERLQRILKSNAWARLKAVPVVQFVREQLLSEYSASGELSEAWQWINAPETKQWLGLAGDALSEEVFVCTGDDFAETLERLVRLGRNEAPIKIQIHQSVRINDGGSSVEESRTQTADWAKLAKHVDKLRVPNALIGFKVSDQARVEAQLERLETWLREALADYLPIDRLKWATVGGRRFLSLELDGSLVPWEDFDAEGEFDEEDREKAIAALRRVTLVVSLGLHGDYLIAAVGPSRKMLETLGEGDRLVQRKELAPLLRAGGQRLIDVEYRSQRLQEALSAPPDVSKKPTQNASQILPLLGGMAGIEIDPDVVETLVADLERLAQDLPADALGPRASVYFSSLVDQGIESVSYEYGPNPRQDGARPLGLLSHVGADPLFFSIQRRKSIENDYRRIAGFAKAWAAFAEGVVLSNFDETEREQYEGRSQPVKQLLEAADETTRKLLLPALADGQLGLLIGSETRHGPATAEAPGDEPEMPVWLPALIAGVSDRPKLEQALRQYRVATDKFLAALRRLEPELPPEFQNVPAPATEQAADGVVYHYDLPAELGLDQRIEPALALGENAMALSLSRDQAKQILSQSRWRPQAGPLVEWREKPLYSATYFNCTRLIDAAQPWIELAVTNFPEGMFDNRLGPFGPAVIRPGQQPDFGDIVGRPIVVVPEQTEEEKAEESRVIVEQIRGFLEVLRVLRGVSIICYEEDGAVVTRRLIEIEDLPAATAEK